MYITCSWRIPSFVNPKAKVHDGVKIQKQGYSCRLLKDQETSAKSLHSTVSAPRCLSIIFVAELSRGVPALK